MSGKCDPLLSGPTRWHRLGNADTRERARRPLSIIACAAALAAMLDGAAAQVPIPRIEDPSRIERRFEPAPTPESTPRPLVIPEADRPVPPAGAERVRFVLRTVQVEGNTVLSETDLRPRWQRYLGQEISLVTVFEIAADLTVFYRNQGYILSRAIVPPQEITGGNVKFEIIEGYIDNVVVQGKPTGPKSQIESKLEGIKASRPLDIRTMERYMLLLNDLPSVNAQSVIRPSPTVAGASELVIILEETYFNASLSIDNRGTRYVGPLQETGTVNLSNILGLYDATEFRIARAQEVDFTGKPELWFFSGSHTELLTTEGTSFRLDGSYTRTHLGDNLQDLDIVGRATRVSAAVTHPWIRTRSENLGTQLTFTYLNSDTDVLQQPFTEDHTRWIGAVGSYDFVDRWLGVNLARFEFQQGLDVMGATDNNSPLQSNANGRSDFTKANLDLVRDQSIGLGWSVFGAITGQYAFSQLLATQEFTFGGKDFGRGYDPSEIAGDHGLAGSLELRYGRPAAEVASWLGEWIESFQAFVFYDYGAVWRIDDTREPGGARDTAASTGIGTRVNVTPKVFFSVEVDLPLTRPPTVDRDDGEKHPRFFFRATGRL